MAPGVRPLFEKWLASEGVEIGPRESLLFLFMHAYLDVSFGEQTHLNAKAVRAMLVVHCVNHVLKGRDEVNENTEKLDAQESGTGDVGTCVADKGFSSPRVLILCPFRSICHDLVKMILSICPAAKQVMNQKRFREEFSPGVVDDAEGSDKPADWLHVFGGNNDDSFAIGLNILRRAVKLHAPLDKSDMLICSPLGLRQMLGDEGKRRKNADFLSSIEVCVMDRADVLRMQNWEHVVEIMSLVNCKPVGLQGIDISRLRPQFADGRARNFRQTVVSAAGQNFEIDGILTAGCSDAPGMKAEAAPTIGKAKRKKRWGVLDEEEDEEVDGLGAAAPAAVPAGQFGSCRGSVRLADAPDGAALRHAATLGIARQVFLHAAGGAGVSEDERLFDAFRTRYWKPIGKTLERLLIVANSYFSFLRIRRFLKKNSISFCSVCEFSSSQDLGYVRTAFTKGEKKVLLVSQRFLWYRRYHFTGADYVLFYGTPDTAEIYEHVLRDARTPSLCNSMCLFRTHDFLALERIVGRERATRMAASKEGKVFVVK